MSFREKSAWITLFSVLVCFGAYFADVFSRFGADRHFGVLGSIHLLLLSTAALVALQVGLNLAAAWTTPKDGRGPADEREIQIQRRSHSLGYHVLMVLALGLFAPGLFGHRGIEMANFALLAVVISALTVSIAQIVMFRRGG